MQEMLIGGTVHRPVQKKRSQNILSDGIRNTLTPWINITKIGLLRIPGHGRINTATNDSKPLSFWAGGASYAE
jgi:hypothetical protein